MLTREDISSTPHSPQAVPLAKSPSGVNTTKTAIRIYKGLNAPANVPDFGAPSKVSGDTFSTKVRIAVVRTTSAIPNKVRCPIIIAGTEILSGYGQYNAFPAASVKRIGWMPNSIAAQNAATLIPT